MGKKKIAIVDLSQSESPQLKATGVRSQRLTIKKPAKAVEAPLPEKPIAAPKPAEVTVKKAAKKKTKHGRSRRYLEAKKLIDKTKSYSVDEAVKVLRQISQLKFDSTVELHCNLNVDKLSGELTLPHLSGKKAKVEIASDKTLAKLNDGVIDFDLLVAEPKMMPKLAKHAKLLGPKGLMPNPKMGTITDKPEELKKKLEAGNTIRYKSEAKAPLLHLTVGKLSLKDSELIANIQAVISTILPRNLTSVYLCSSMSPSIKLLVA